MGVAVTKVASRYSDGTGDEVEPDWASTEAGATSPKTAAQAKRYFMIVRKLPYITGEDGAAGAEGSDGAAGAVEPDDPASYRLEPG